MPFTNQEAIDLLRVHLSEQERDYVWLSRKIGKSYLWVLRRFNGDTPMRIDDFGLMMGAFEETHVTV